MILRKTKVVQAIADELGLKNVVVHQQQAQVLKESFEFTDVENPKILLSA